MTPAATAAPARPAPSLGLDQVPPPKHLGRGRAQPVGQLGAMLPHGAPADPPWSSRHPSHPPPPPPGEAPGPWRGLSRGAWRALDPSTSARGRRCALSTSSHQLRGHALALARLALPVHQGPRPRPRPRPPRAARAPRPAATPRAEAGSAGGERGAVFLVAAPPTVPAPRTGVVVPRFGPLSASRASERTLSLQH